MVLISISALQIDVRKHVSPACANLENPAPNGGLDTSVDDGYTVETGIFIVAQSGVDLGEVSVSGGCR